MRTTLLVLAAALLACDAKPADAPSDGKKSAQAAAKPDATAKPDANAKADAAAEPDPTATAMTNDAAPATGPVLDHTVKLLDGSEKSLADYRGKALLVVNTASECGFTPQYADLQELYAKYQDRGLEVLAFPSNDFGGQEPGTPEEIRTFVDREYSVEFEMFDKVVIKGPDKAPLYQTLTEQTPEGIKGEVKWNFTKFLVDPQGRVVKRFDSAVSPTSPEVIAAVESVLPKA